MTLKQLITARYGAGSHRLSSKLSRLSTKLASAKNHVIFLERCKANSIVPTFLRNRCPVSSPLAKRITQRYRLDMLRATLHMERKKWHRLSHQIRETKDTLKRRFNTEDFTLVTGLANKTFEKTFEKTKKQLKEKFEKLNVNPNKRRPDPTRPPIIKNPVLQLQKDNPLPPEAIALLSLGPKFAVTPKEIPKMEVMCEVEKCCLTLERQGKKEQAQEIRHNTADLLKKAKKPKSNLTGEQKKGLAYLKKNRDLSVTPFDKGQGFVTIEKEKLVEKSEKEFQNVTLDTPDTTDTLERKIQKKCRDLKKEGKFDDATYKQVYPSGSITPASTPAIKAHKQQSDYPARLITSHIGAPQEGIASHLNGILRPFIEKSPYMCKNSFEFVEFIKDLKLRTHDKQNSFDAKALFPSVPLPEALRHILELLERDDELHKRTKLTPYDIIDLIDLCLSSSDFVYNDRHHTAEGSGPIGLCLMVSISQIWMDYTMDEALKIARQRQITLPRHIKVYMDDSWLVINDPPRREGLRSNSHNDQQQSPAAAFQDCLNAVHPRVQFTREEEEDNSIAFLDCHVTRHDDGKLTTKIYRKPSNTNIGIKPQSCQEPKTAIACFKGELCRCYRLCTSLEQAKKEIEFTLDLFEANGHNRAQFKNILDNYTPPTNENRKDRTTNRHKQNQQKTTEENDTRNLFDQLPFVGIQIGEIEQKAYACLTYVPEIAPQLKRILTKAGVNTTFKPAPKLKDILCGKDKTHAPLVKKKGIYKYTCTCTNKPVYIGQTARAFNTRWDEHGKAINRQQWQHSGISQHHQHCPQNFSVDNFEPIQTMQGKHKRKLGYDLRVREAMEIRRHGSGPGKGLNEDMGAYIKTDMWDPILASVT